MDAMNTGFGGFYAGPPRSRPKQRSYSVALASKLRDALVGLALKRGITPSELVRAAALVAPDGHRDIEDPGEPLPGDRDVTYYPRPLGPPRAVRRKPRLKLRLPDGLDEGTIRRLIALALALDDGDGWRLRPASELDRMRALEANGQELRDMMERLAVMPLKDGVKTARQAAYLMGFLVEYGLDPDVVNARFRALAPIYHPDRGLLADPVRMAQLIAARKLLLDGRR